VARQGDFCVLLEFGGVGLGGLGSHAHNDMLSLCVNWGRHRVLVDPGSFLYTSDPEARNRFRSTRAHGTVMVDHREQLPIPDATPEDVFRLPGPASPGRVIDLNRNRIVVEGPVSQGSDAGAVRLCRDVSVRTGDVAVRDRVAGRGEHTVTWSFPFHPDVDVTNSGASFELSPRGTEGPMTFECGVADGLATRRGAYSRFYGQSEPSVCVTRETTSVLPCEWAWRLRAPGPG
jgi:hypothetical protein